ncbi:MAG: hypothetical protein OIN84_16500 [Candidatus Methanoperedens sp.]|uniref:hypothetical protein n=1 Tax=Candidatus Methanoperedens sp. BLZ2 TaxID=2035255 RepID=UPI000BE2DA6A|nr:hypothetical protein [Candidatus Methanoperedens sp. BLZ2]KAB2941322.1 MAG: hypothetical protein F9K14_18540 [Candidatus Methanoperedens sp.]MBZ0173687.1 hypothetical protein [Candidatus Methanoperedens nitroreducens]MCX9079566.1 hypothetical protein [Candidatus Methanoperedens sp.]
MIENEIKFLWQIKFHINPSLKESEIIDDYNFEVHNHDTFVNYNFETNSYDMQGSEFEYIQQTARKHESIIRNLMLEYMIYQENFRPIKIEFSGHKLLNEEKLANAGLLKNRNFKKSLSARYNVLYLIDSLKKVMISGNQALRIKLKNLNKKFFAYLIGFKELGQTPIW